MSLFFDFYSLTFCINFQEDDVALTVFTVTKVRTEGADFTYPLFVDQQAILWVLPEVEPDLAGFVHPYTYDVSIF